MATESTGAGQDMEFENSKAEINNTSRNGSGSATEGSSVASSSPAARRATGPRTKRGKERSKHNALKHGILAKVVLLNGEPRNDFDFLLNGFRSALRPVGLLEETLVEKLAALQWRYRRFLIAEQAEIRRGTEYVRWDKWVRRDQEATVFFKGQNAGKIMPGLILGKQNPLILAMCVELLQALKEFIEWRGFDEGEDIAILRRVYGDSVVTVATYFSLPMFYTVCFIGSRLTEEERLKKDCPTPEEYKAGFLKVLEKQIKGFQACVEKAATVTDQIEQLEATSRNVPEGAALDRLLRYEASLDRSFDRTLSQIERLQRMRLGQPVLPKLEVRHTLS